MSQDPMDAVQRVKLAQRAERRRARKLALADRNDKARQTARKKAQLEVKQGVYVHLDEAIESPTEEWLAKGDVQSFTPKQLPGTIRTAKSVRRVQRGQIEAAYQAGRLTEEQFAAACWFRKIYEQAGMAGRWPSVQLGRISSSGDGAAQAPMPMHEYEIYCRDQYRAVMAQIDPFYHDFWEAVVINSISMRAACRLAKCRNEKIFNRLAAICDQVAAYCAGRRILLKPSEAETSSVQAISLPVAPNCGH